MKYLCYVRYVGTHFCGFQAQKEQRTVQGTLTDILSRLTDAGNTVVVIEHNLDVIKVADYIIDLGPEGGDAGGELVFAGTPEDCAACEESYTGQYLKKVLETSGTEN